MVIHIEDSEIQATLRELAEFTGESPTDAIAAALRERLQRLKNQGRTGMAERLMEIGRDCAARLSEAERSFDVDGWLYDKDGLPH
jgi:antitoxin VapB